MHSRHRGLLIVSAIALIAVASMISAFFFEHSKAGSEGLRLFSQHEVLGVERGDVLFIGDDVTAEALWNELYPNIAIRNRGVNGQTSDDLLLRIVPLAQAGPRKILLNIGANDVLQGNQPAHILANYRELINLIQAFSPKTTIVCSSVLPLDTDSEHGVQVLNAQLSGLADQLDIEYIDLAGTLLDDAGRFKPEMADRRMRLLGQGYANWKALLGSYL